MSKKTKIILSIIGLSAVLIPAILLVVLTSRGPGKEPEVPTQKRQIDTEGIQDTVRKIPKKEVILPKASPASPSAEPSENVSE